MPPPVSATSTATAPPSAARTRTRSAPPPGIASSAFRHRLSSTWRSCAASAVSTTGPGGASTVTRTRCRSARPRTSPATARTTPSRSTGCRSTFGGRAKSRNVWSDCSIRRTSSSMIRRSSTVSAPATPSASAACTSSLIAVSGLRISCPTPAANCPTAANCSARSTSRSRCCNCCTTDSMRPASWSISACRPPKSPSPVRTISGGFGSSLPAASRTRTWSRRMDRLSPRATPNPSTTPATPPRTATPAMPHANC